MICERCKHELHVIPHGGQVVDACLVNLHRDLATAEQLRDQWKQAAQNSTDIAMRGTAKLRAELDESREMKLDAETRACAAEERAHRLETALRWYARFETWRPDHLSNYSDADMDRGTKARAVLEERP